MPGFHGAGGIDGLNASQLKRSHPIDMRSKPAGLLAIALGCGGVAAFAASQVIQDKGQPVIETVDILVASQEISVNTKITPDKFVLEKWPRDRLPQGAIQDAKVVEGKYTNQRLFPGEPLLERKVNLTKENVADRIPEGYRVFDLELDKKRGATGYIQPGDRVDVYAYFKKDERVAESRTMLISESVEVFMVDGRAVRSESEDAPKPANVIQLLVKPGQYEALNTADNIGTVKVSLSPPRENNGADSDQHEQFLDWVKKSVRVETAPTAGALSTVKQQPAPVAKKLITIISPNTTNVYEATDDGSLPKKLSGDGSASNTANTAASNQLVSGYEPQTSPSPQSPTSGVVWDGKQWVWGGTGFKPTYPTADEGKKKQQGSNAGNDKTQSTGERTEPVSNP
jgi:pilus assembly protein CpaB